MNKKESNQHAMIMAVENVFGKYQEEVDSLSVLKNLVEEFKNRNSEIKDVQLIQQGKITGTAEQKQKEEKEMIEETLRLSAILYVYALENSNFELAEKTNLSFTRLNRLNQSKLPAQCRIILQLLKGHVENLAEFGVTADDASQLEKEISDFEEIVAMPRNQIVTRSEANGRLTDLLKEQMILLKQKTDKLMLSFKTKSPVFYNEYKSARIIVNMGIRHEKHDDENESIAA